MAKKSEKTNALRLLDKLKIPYEAHSYPCEEFTGGEDVARQLGLDPADVCKTLVTVGSKACGRSRLSTSAAASGACS